jgi:hypothetical protein
MKEMDDMKDVKGAMTMTMMTMTIVMVMMSFLAVPAGVAVVVVVDEPSSQPTNSNYTVAGNDTQK